MHSINYSSHEDGRKEGRKTDVCCNTHKEVWKNPQEENEMLESRVLIREGESTCTYNLEINYQSCKKKKMKNRMNQYLICGIYDLKS